MLGLFCKESSTSGSTPIVWKSPSLGLFSQTPGNDLRYFCWWHEKWFENQKSRIHFQEHWNPSRVRFLTSPNKNNDQQCLQLSSFWILSLGFVFQGSCTNGKFLECVHAAHARPTQRNTQKVNWTPKWSHARKNPDDQKVFNLSPTDSKNQPKQPLNSC